MAWNSPSGAVGKVAAFLVCGVATAGTAISFGSLGALGCGGGEASAVAGSKLPEGVRSTSIAHEECNEGGHHVDMLDVTNDGKPDIKRVTDGSREICRITDLNHDGHPDLFEYFDGSGQLRRREFDFDDNGVVNQIDIYENGKLVRREADTTNQGRIDTWDTFDPGTGARVKRERDSTGDGRLDQWWSYQGDPKNPKITIAMDKTGDGQPDLDATIVLGDTSGGAGAPPPPGADAGPLAMADAGAAAPPAPPAPAPSGTDLAPSVAPVTDAGIPGKPQRGPAKR
jgi:hypothetical protein